MIFLDTDALIMYLRGKPNMAAFLARNKDELFAIATPVLFELYYGFYFTSYSRKYSNDQFLQKKLKKEKRHLLQFLNDVNTFDLTIDSIKKSAKISAKLDANGEHIGKFDCLIAGIILSHGYKRIATKNSKHFTKIKELSVLEI